MYKEQQLMNATMKLLFIRILYKYKISIINLYCYTIQDQEIIHLNFS